MHALDDSLKLLAGMGRGEDKGGKGVLREYVRRRKPSGVDNLCRGEIFWGSAAVSGSPPAI